MIPGPEKNDIKENFITKNMEEACEGVCVCHGEMWTRFHRRHFDDSVADGGFFQ